MRPMHNRGSQEELEMATPCQRRAHAYPCYLLILLPMIACCLLRRTVAVAQSRPTTGEAELLLQIKHAWGDPPALAEWDWSAADWSNATSAPGAHCRWSYVRCDSAGHVISLDLSNNNIYGAFAMALYGFTSLRYLNLSYNNIRGELPRDIGHGLAANLRTLALSFNKFNGSIPASLPKLRNLRHLELEGNGFTGTIPAELGELRSLKTLWLAYNSFDTGKLPTSFKNMTKLVSLWAAGCDLIGNFPSYVVNMTELVALDLAQNSLTGSLPVEIWSLQKLQFLDIYMNNLTGHLVVHGFAARGLYLIDLSSNKLVGGIPKVFGRLENLIELTLDNNRFSGTLPLELGRHSPGLSVVHVGDNMITGDIPKWLCAQGRLQYFNASNNYLNGSIPEGLERCATLQKLYLANNKLSGRIC